MPSRQNDSVPPGPVRLFPEGWNQDAIVFKPAAIAGTPDQLRALEHVWIPSLTHALIVLFKCDAATGSMPSCLSASDRDWFWLVFGLPLFEQVISNRGQLLAAECEAHNGLHLLAADIWKPESLNNSRITLTPCRCGRKTPRIGAITSLETGGDSSDPLLRRAAHAG